MAAAVETEKMRGSEIYLMLQMNEFHYQSILIDFMPFNYIHFQFRLHKKVGMHTCTY